MNDRAQIPVWFLFTVMAVMSLTAAGFLYLGTQLGSTANLPEDEVKVLSRVYEQVRTRYYKDVTADGGRQLMEEAIKGMVSSLDEYSEFIPERETTKFDEAFSGVYYGIGAYMHGLEKEVVVLYPFPGGPAEKAGLLPGDRVIRVGDQLLANIQTTNLVQSAATLIKGRKAGTKVTLGLRRGEREFEQIVERNAVPQPSVRWVRLVQQDPPVGYLYLSDFVDNSIKEFDQAIAKLNKLAAKSGKGPLRGLIFDLRHNTGGALHVCVKLANRFLRSGKIVTLQRPRDNKVMEKHQAVAKHCTLPKLPLVLLVNGQSASASEVLAGALQDHKRARLVGMRTYGKGLVQSILSWKGLPIRLKITTSEYRTPNNRNIHSPRDRSGRRKKAGTGGIEPDKVVRLGDVGLRDVYSRLAEYQVPDRYLTAYRELAKQLKIETREPLDASKDAQLEAALNEIRGLLNGSKGDSPRPTSQKATPQKVGDR